VLSINDLEYSTFCLGCFHYCVALSLQRTAKAAMSGNEADEPPTTRVILRIDIECDKSLSTMLAACPL
jgi:hypothetical protein